MTSNHNRSHSGRLARRALFATALLALAITGQICNTPNSGSDMTGVPTTQPITVQPQPTVRLETTKGVITLKLFPQQAPKTVENFLQYVNDGWYDGTIFSEVNKGKWVVAGAYLEDLTSKTTRDPVPNESNNGLTNLRCRVALTDPDGPGTGTSQFLINLDDNPGNDFNLETGDLGLTVFGEVIEGMDVATAIGDLATTSKTAEDGSTLEAFPSETVKILAAHVDTGVPVTPNTAPAANAGPMQIVQIDSLVTLDGSASADPDGDPLTYTWRQTSGPAVTLNDATAAKPTFTPTVVGTLTFELNVNDGKGGTATAVVTVRVDSPTNRAPVAYAGPNQNVQVGAQVTLDGSGSTDPDGLPLSYLWTQTAGETVSLSSATAVNPTFFAPQTGGVLTLQLTVTDAGGGTASSSVSVTVNSRPIANAGSDRKVAQGVTVTLKGSGSDPDPGDVPQFLWEQTAGPAVTLSNPQAQQPTFVVPSDVAPLSFKLTVTDGKGGTGSANITLAPVSQPKVRLNTSMGEVLIEVLQSQAPITAVNFLQYVEDSFYDGTIFHRIISDFVVQGGGFLPDLSRKPGLRGPIQNEFSPDRSNIRGTLAMAKLGNDPNSATSQFFFNLGDNSSNLDNQNGGFTVFARVIEGMEVVDAMAAVATGDRSDPDGNTFEDVPLTDILVSSATLE